MKRLCCLLVVFLALTFAVGEVNGLAKLAYSPYNTFEFVGVGDVKEIAVCKVFNQGDEPLILNCAWTQDSGAMVLPVTIKAPNQTLSPGASVEILLIVATPSDEYIGNYSGHVEIEGKLLTLPPSGMSGVVPAGTANVSMAVKYLKLAEFVVYSLVLKETEIVEGEEIHASVSVENVGEMIGSCTLVMALDGVAVRTAGVTLGWGKQRTIDFSCRINTTGLHVISIGDLSKTFNVKPKPAVTSDQGEGMPLMPILVLGVASLTCGVGLACLVRDSRKNKHAKKLKGNEEK